MMGEKSIVLTVYGQNESTEGISISLFDKSMYSTSSNNAINYCNTINGLELKDNQWIHAGIIDENKKIILQKHPQFDIINKLADLSLQRILREVSKNDLAKALVNIDESTMEKINRNMTKRSAKMLQEDINALHSIDHNDIKLSRRKIIDAIQRLINTGEIVILM
jgi:hypothetical protein